MKITFNETKLEFTPFEFTVKVETLEDARAWHAIFDYTPNTSILGIEGSSASAIRNNLINKVGHNKDIYVDAEDEVIANGVTYDQYYK